MIETGARLRLGGVLHVQQRGWADRPSTSRSHEAPPEAAASYANAVPETRTPEQETPDIVRENGDIEKGFSGREEGEREGGCRDGAMGGGVKKASARKEAVYSKENLAKRKERLLSQRYDTRYCPTVFISPSTTGT